MFDSRLPSVSADLQSNVSVSGPDLVLMSPVRMFCFLLDHMLYAGDPGTALVQHMSNLPT